MKFLRWLDKNLEEKIMMILLMAMTLIMGVQVVCRYVFNNSLSWTEELTRFLFVWITFISIGYCLEKKISLRIEQLVTLLPQMVQYTILLVVNLLMTAFFIYMIPQAWAYAASAIASGQKSSAMSINMAWVQGSTVVGFGLAFARSVQNIIRNVVQLRKTEDLLIDERK